MKIGTAEEAGRLDTRALESYAVPQAILMEHAAQATLEVMEERRTVKGLKVLIACGPGNNGGDGLALARLLHGRGARPFVIMPARPDTLSGAAAVNHLMLTRLPVEIRHDIEDLDTGAFDLVVDALLGTGLSRKVEGPYKVLITLINRSSIPVIALDLPSGVHADTG